MFEQLKRKLMIKWLEKYRQEKSELVESCYLGLELENNEGDRETIIHNRTQAKEDHFHLCRIIKLLNRTESVN